MDKNFPSSPITYLLTDQLIDVMFCLSLQLESVCLGHIWSGQLSV